jgi:hypothetical protein
LISIAGLFTFYQGWTMVGIAFIKQQHTTTILSTNAMLVESEQICFIFIGPRRIVNFFLRLTIPRSIWIRSLAIIQDIFVSCPSNWNFFPLRIEFLTLLLVPQLRPWLKTRDHPLPDSHLQYF